MNKEEQLYNIIILGLKLNENTLANYGYTNEDIQKLINDKIIIEENSEYKLAKIDNLYQYGIKLLINREHKRANTCFYKCHKLDPEHRKACLQIFLTNLKRKNYSALADNYIVVESIKSEKYQNDNALYLYLLNMLIPIPSEYQDRIDTIDIDSISDQKSNNEKEANIRYAIMHNKFTYALKSLNDMISEIKGYNVENEVLKELLIQVLVREKDFKLSIFYLAKKKEYQKIITALEYKSKKRYLGNDEIYIQIVSKAILNILETREIPIVDSTYTNSLYQALNNNNFKLAQKLNNKFMKKVDKDPESSTLNILLLEINKLINY